MSSSSSEAAIVVHGGAGAHEMILLDPTYKEAKSQGVQHAARAGWKVLQEGGSAVDAVEAALLLMENDPCFNAGVGGNLTRTGQVQMDAVLMDGRLDIGGVCGVTGTKNPITLARTIKDECDTCMLYGEGAMQFAAEKGFHQLPNSYFVTEVMEQKLKQWEQRNQPKPVELEGLSHDTVGAVVRDASGLVAAGISTGGMCGMRDGRLGAGATIGAGAYADNRAGAASTTGCGDALVKTLLASNIVGRMSKGSSGQTSVDEGVAFMQQSVEGGWGGAVAVDSSGSVGIAFSSKCMPWACVQAGTMKYGVCQGDVCTERV